MNGCNIGGNQFDYTGDTGKGNTRDGNRSCQWRVANIGGEAADDDDANWIEEGGGWRDG